MDSFESRKKKLIAQRGVVIKMMNDAVVGVAQSTDPKAVAACQEIFAIAQKRERDIWAQLKDLGC